MHKLFLLIMSAATLFSAMTADAGTKQFNGYAATWFDTYGGQAGLYQHTIWFTTQVQGYSIVNVHCNGADVTDAFQNDHASIIGNAVFRWVDNSPSANWSWNVTWGQN